MKLITIRKEVEQRLSIDLLNASRQRELVYARSVYFKLCRTITGMTTTDIGKSVGKHHASVLHGLHIFDDVITKHETKLYEVYCEVLKELTDKPKYYDAPVVYWMEKCYDLEKDMDKLADDYEKLWRRYRYLAGKVKGMGFKMKILDEPVRRYTKKEARRQEEQRSNQGSLQGAGQTA